jgi:hypothetical protein
VCGELNLEPPRWNRSHVVLFLFLLLLAVGLPILFFKPDAPRAPEPIADEQFAAQSKAIIEGMIRRRADAERFGAVSVEKVGAVANGNRTVTGWIQLKSPDGLPPMAWTLRLRESAPGRWEPAHAKIDDGTDDVKRGSPSPAAPSP